MTKKIWGASPFSDGFLFIMLPIYIYVKRREKTGPNDKIFEFGTFIVSKSAVLSERNGMFVLSIRCKTAE